MHASEEGFVADSKPIEVVEDLIPIGRTHVSVRLPKTVRRATLEPQGEEIRFASAGKRTELALEGFACHQMVVFHYDVG